jgi:CBS-domain-containing membrane protein
MTKTKKTKNLPLTLQAKTAAELMSPNPMSLREDAPIEEAIAKLVSKGFRAAPVIDAAGRPIGVLSTSDVLINEREKTQFPAKGAAPPTRVRDLMTPAVFSVRADDPVRGVVGQMAALNVHQLYVVDADGVLIGVISALDVVRHLAE